MCDTGDRATSGHPDGRIASTSGELTDRPWSMMVSRRLWLTSQVCAIIESSISDPVLPVVIVSFRAS
jgi:hypothetical protein